MRTKKDILETIKSHRKDIQGYGVRNVGLYGSYLNEKQHSESDIDILVDLKPEAENFDNFMDLCDFLENLFQGENVDIVTKSGLSPYIGPKILEEVVYA